jgi:hypothetical protein
MSRAAGNDDARATHTFRASAMRRDMSATRRRRRSIRPRNDAARMIDRHHPSPPRVRAFAALAKNPYCPAVRTCASSAVMLCTTKRPFAS